MTRTDRTRRRLTAAVVLTGLVSALLVASPFGTASAVTKVTPTIAYSPTGPFADGDLVTLTVNGFTANRPVAVSECPTGRVVNGPGDCGHTVDGAAKLITIDENGHGTATLTVRTGALGNATPPAATCDPLNACSFSAIDISDLTSQVSVPILYASSVPSLGFTPGGALRDGTKISVTGTGFTPGSPVSVAQCPAGRPILGPGDCGRSASGAAALVVANADGYVHATLRIAYGTLGNQTLPAAVCTAKHPCDVVATNIADPSEQLFTAITFSSRQVTPKISLRLSRSSVDSGDRVRFTGTVTPDANGETVQLQRKVGTKWVTKKSANVGSQSKYSISWTPISTKDYRWRIHLKKTAYHPAASSASRKLAVH